MCWPLSLSLPLCLYPPIPILSRVFSSSSSASRHTHTHTVCVHVRTHAEHRIDASLLFRIPPSIPSHSDVEEQLVQLVLPWPGSSRDLSVLCTLDVSLGREYRFRVVRNRPALPSSLVGSADPILACATPHTGPSREFTSRDILPKKKEKEDQLSQFDIFNPVQQSRESMRELIKCNNNDFLEMCETQTQMMLDILIVFFVFFEIS